MNCSVDVLENWRLLFASIDPLNIPLRLLLCRQAQHQLPRTALSEAAKHDRVDEVEREILSILAGYMMKFTFSIISLRFFSFLSLFDSEIY